MYTEQDYVLTAQLAQNKIKQYHELNRMNCLSCRDIESDDGGYIFAEYRISDIKKDTEELKEYVDLINNIIETSIYCGYVEMAEYPKSWGVLRLYPDDYPLDEAKIKYFKNPDGALKNKMTRKKNSNIQAGKKVNVHITNKNDKLKKEEVEDIEEAMVLNKEDNYYNKEKLDSGEINLCFITGHPGSGKSTMSKNMASNNSKVEHYELDDVIMNEDFSIEDLKGYGDLMYSFFNGVGKKYKITKDDILSLDTKFENYYKNATQDFVKYAISYSSSHKGTIFVIEGIWLFMYIEPEVLKDYAVYIKGTSTLVSAFRAFKRELKDGARWQPGQTNNRSTWAIAYTKDLNIFTFEKMVNKYRSYFNNSIQESTSDNIEEAAKDAKKLLYKEIIKCKDRASAYMDIMLPYMRDNAYAIIGCNIQNLQEQDRIAFIKYKSAVFNYCSKIFNDTHPQYLMNMDENCIYIQKIFK